MIQGEIICSNYYIDASPPPPQMAGLVPDKLGRFTAKMAWRPASILELDLRQGPLEGEDWPALHLPSTHYLTPETERTTHYFASISRNLKVPDAAQDKVMLDFVVRAFTQEDEPMVRACQELMGTTDLFSLHPTILKTDIAAVQARRLLEKRRRAERSAAGDDETRA